MAITFDGTQVTDVRVDGAACDLVRLDGVEVWRRALDDPPAEIWFANENGYETAGWEFSQTKYLYPVRVRARWADGREEYVPVRDLEMAWTPPEAYGFFGGGWASDPQGEYWIMVSFSGLPSEPAVFSCRMKGTDLRCYLQCDIE